VQPGVEQAQPKECVGTEDSEDEHDATPIRGVNQRHSTVHAKPAMEVQGP